MKKLHYIKCYPSGNPTILVSTEVARMRQAGIGKKILLRHPDVEQVGFIEKATNAHAVARLQMAGGEFCGNATRALAYVLYKNNGYGVHPTDKEFFLEVSGADKILKAGVSEDSVCVEMPVNLRLDAIKQAGDRTIVDMGGICHILINREPPENLLGAAESVLAELGLKIKESAGVIYYRVAQDRIYITPVVWVRDVQTLIAETACGSGTISIAVAHAIAHHQDNLYRLPVYQPSGKAIYASVKIKDEMISEAFIEGPVEILEESEFVDTSAVE